MERESRQKKKNGARGHAATSLLRNMELSGAVELANTAVFASIAKQSVAAFYSDK